MKIGEVSRRYGIAVSAIRYYIEKDLLLPGGDRYQHNFTEKDCEDLEIILQMKQQRFLLEEISFYMSLRRLSNMIEPDTLENCIQMLQRKKQELQNEAVQLQTAIEGIDCKIAEISNRVNSTPRATGVPLQALSLLTCPECGKPLALTGARFEDGFIFEGDLFCTCGYRARIDGGIVDTGVRYEGGHDTPNLTRNFYSEKGYQVANALQKCHKFLTGKMKETGIEGKVILEMHVNSMFYFYNHLQLLPKDGMLIVVDRYPEMLRMYKSLFELLDAKGNILYIADNSCRPPVRSGCVDTFVVDLSENEHELYFHTSLVRDIHHLLKEHCRVLGIYVEAPAASRTRINLRKKYPEGGTHYMNAPYLEKELKDLGFRTGFRKVASCTESRKTGYLECHVDGEELSWYVYTAVK